MTLKTALMGSTAVESVLGLQELHDRMASWLPIALPLTLEAGVYRARFIAPTVEDKPQPFVVYG